MYDVAIIGAGIAGCALAKKLVDSGFDVVVIERDHRFKIDSGIVAKRNIGSDIPKKFIEHKVSSMEFVSPSGGSVVMKTKEPFAYILDRQKLNKYYRDRIRKNLVFDEVRLITWLEDCVSITCKETNYLAKMVVGCDGASSVVRKYMYIKDALELDGEVVFGALAFDDIRSHGIRVYFNKHFSKDFFAWTIEQTREYGIMVGKDPMDYINHFRNRFGLKLNNLHVYSMTIGAKTSVSDRCLLVGESAGQSKPITGGGIDLALVSTNYAFETIKNAFASKRFDKKFLMAYENLWKGDFGKEIERQMFLRKIYRELNNKQIDDLFRIGRKNITDVSDINDYIQLSSLVKSVSKIDLFLWGFRNFGTVARAL